MADPHIMPDGDAMAAAPFEEFRLIRAQAVFAGAVGEMVHGGAFQRVIAGVDAHLRGDGAEFADLRVDHVRVVGDVGVVAQAALGDAAARADLVEASEARVAHLRGGIDFRRIAEDTPLAVRVRIFLAALCHLILSLVVLETDLDDYHRIFYGVCVKG